MMITTTFRCHVWNSFLNEAKQHVAESLPLSADVLRTFLHDFLVYGPDNVAFLEYLLNLGARSCHMIAWAVEKNKPKILRAMLRRKFSPDGDDECGNSAINLAHLFGNKECAKLLLDAGAKLTKVMCARAGWMQNYVAALKKARAAATIILGLHSYTRSRVIKETHNGNDVLKLIARCVLETRGHDGWL